MQSETKEQERLIPVDLEKFFASFRTESMRAAAVLDKNPDKNELDVYVDQLSFLYKIYRSAILKNDGDNAFAKEYYSNVCGSIFYYFGKVHKTSPNNHILELHKMSTDYSLRTEESDAALIAAIRMYYKAITTIKSDDVVCF